jgi:hypothetical protein
VNNDHGAAELADVAVDGAVNPTDVPASLSEEIPHEQPLPPAAEPQPPSLDAGLPAEPSGDPLAEMAPG